jgi:hypothetical protein
MPSTELLAAETGRAASLPDRINATDPSALTDKPFLPDLQPIRHFIGARPAADHALTSAATPAADATFLTRLKRKLSGATLAADSAGATSDSFEIGAQERNAYLQATTLAAMVASDTPNGRPGGATADSTPAPQVWSAPTSLRDVPDGSESPLLSLAEGARAHGVHFEDGGRPLHLPSGNARPAPPEQVLARAADPQTMQARQELAGDAIIKKDCRCRCQIRH